jgi:hypothetical protein
MARRQCQCVTFDIQIWKTVKCVIYRYTIPMFLYDYVILLQHGRENVVVERKGAAVPNMYRHIRQAQDPTVPAQFL